MIEKRKAILEGDVGYTIARLTVPMFFGIIGMVAFNLADTYFVGQLGANDLAAMSYTFPVVLVISSIAMGIGIGISSVVSRAIGNGSHDTVVRLTTDGLILAVLMVMLFVTAGLLTIQPLFSLLGADGIILEKIKSYMTIWYSGVVFVIIPMAGNNAIRATGDTTTPSIVMLVAVFMNILLDPILIFGIGPFPKMGLAGAATATVIARAVTLFVALYVLILREKLIGLHGFSLQSIIFSWKKILYVGVPTAATQMIIPVSIGIITRFVSAYGPEAVAAFGTGSRIEIFSLSVIMAIASVLAPFIGQNYGAQQYGRVHKAVVVTSRFAFIWGIILFFTLSIFAEKIAFLFNDDPLVIQNLSLFLRVISMSYGFQGMFQLSVASMNVLDKPLHSAFFSLFRMLVLYIPLAYFGSQLFGIIGIFGAGSIANIFAGIASVMWINHFLSKCNRENSCGDV